MTENPYASPAPLPDIYAPTVKPAGLVVPAATWKRLVNLLVDNFILQVISFAAGLLMGIIYLVSRGAAQGALSQAEETGLQLAGYGLGIVVTLAYYAGFEILCQRTPAKFLTGTIVVTVAGGRPTAGQMVGRTFCRFIPFEAFSFLGHECVGWHDSIPKTRVVNVG